MLPSESICLGVPLGEILVTINFLKMLVFKGNNDGKKGFLCFKSNNGGTEGTIGPQACEPTAQQSVEIKISELS